MYTGLPAIFLDFQTTCPLPQPSLVESRVQGLRANAILAIHQLSCLHEFAHSTAFLSLSQISKQHPCMRSFISQICIL